MGSKRIDSQTPIFRPETYMHSQGIDSGKGIVKRFCLGKTQRPQR